MTWLLTNIDIHLASTSLRLQMFVAVSRLWPPMSANAVQVVPELKQRQSRLLAMNFVFIDILQSLEGCAC
jgi:hypothetical protein